MKKIITVFMLVLAAAWTNAQDIIHLKTGEEIKCKLSEVNEDEVKYKEWDYLDGPDFVIPVRKIEFIRFANGREQRFENADMQIGALPESVMKKKQAIKIAFFSPLLGRTILGYERVQRFGLHWEGELGMIGLGKQEMLGNDERGAWISAGPKMLMRKETYTRGERYLHYLQGSYFRPELFFEYQRGTDDVYVANPSGFEYQIIQSDYTLTTFCLMLNLGKQWLLGDVMTLDIFGGVGMASSNAKYDMANVKSAGWFFKDVRPSGIIYPGQNNGEVGVAFKTGFKLGIAF